MFTFFCITQESDPVQMYRSGINGLMKKNSANVALEEPFLAVPAAYTL